MGWLADRLAALDRRNQSVADFLRDRPDAGTRANPYAKRPRAGLWAWLSMLGAAVITASLGWLAGVAAAAAVTIVLWRQSHHPWLDGYERPTPSDEPGEGPSSS